MASRTPGPPDSVRHSFSVQLQDVETWAILAIGIWLTAPGREKKSYRAAINLANWFISYICVLDVC